MQLIMSVAAAASCCMLLLLDCLHSPITSTTMGLADGPAAVELEVLAWPAVRCSASIGAAASMLLLLFGVC